MRALLPDGAGWTAVAYGRLRLLVGVYLAVHFAHLAPWAAELFSSTGMLPDARQSPLAALFPNVLLLFDGPVFVTVFVAAAAAAGLLLAVGLADRAAAVVALYALACLHGRNPLIANPSLPYVGWLLLAHAATPPLRAGVGLWRTGAPAWRLPREIHVVAWVALAAGYTFSGYTKLVSPSWLDGTAVARVLESPLARPGLLRESLLALPAPVLAGLTWGALALEMAFLPLALLPRVRPWLWAALLSMHLGLVALVDFADLSAGMVLFHLYVADPRWLARLRAGRGSV